jgi:hypothetical protein
MLASLTTAQNAQIKDRKKDEKEEGKKKRVECGGKDKDGKQICGDIAQGIL